MIALSPYINSILEVPTEFRDGLCDTVPFSYF